MFDHLNLRNELQQRYVVDIGGGTGLEYEIFKSLSVDFKHFKFIEPSKDMMNIFLDRIGEELNTKISIHNGNFSDLVDEVKDEPNKLLILNSTLHHIIFLNRFLDELKSSMRKGDLFLLSHEPNNDYSKTFLFLQKSIKALTTTSLIKKITFLLKSDVNDAERWNLINQNLLADKVLVKEMSPLLIRRIIDYGVGYKRDWEKLAIPEEFDEGFWNIDDLSSYLGEDYKLSYYQTYRHFGDPNGNLLIYIFNRFMQYLLKNHGSNFIAVWKKVS